MSNRRGRPKTRKYEDIHEVIVKFKESIVTDTGKIVSKTNEIWKVISDELLDRNVTVPKSSLYTYVSCNLGGIRNIITKDIIIDSKSDKADDADDANDTSNSSDISEDSTVKRIEVHFSRKEFSDLCEFKIYNNQRGEHYVIKSFEREYITLKPGAWQLELTKKLWSKSKVKCGFKYSGHKIYNETGRGTFKGQCNCGATINGEFTGKRT